MKMKILFVMDSYGLFGIPNAGASQRNTLFVKSLALMGHVDVCSFSGDDFVSDIEDCDVIYSNLIPEEGNILIKHAQLLIRMLVSPDNPYS